MKKIFVFLLFYLFLFSCENVEDKDVMNDNFVLSEEESFKIVSSSEFQELLTLKILFLKRTVELLENGYSAEELFEISMLSMNEGNHKQFYEVFFDSNSEGVHFIEKLQEAQFNLFDKHPVLMTINAECEKTLSEDRALSFYSGLEQSPETILDFYTNTKSETTDLSDTPNKLVCGSHWAQVKLLTCAGLCGVATVGAGAALCGWACWCMLCTENSAVADAIC